MSLLMDDKPLPPALHSILEDALLGEAYRTVFRDEALEAVFAGAQTEQARVPTASLSAMSDLDAGAERFPRQSRPLAEAREPSILSLPFQGVAFTRNMVGSAVARAAKKYKSETLGEFARRLNEVQFSQTPVGYETALTEAKAAISSIPDNFQRELRDAAVRADNPEQAFNNLLVTRMSRELGQINRSLEAQVNALVAGGMPREEAMSLLAYQQRAGTSEEALGKYIAMAGVVADAQTRMLEPAYNVAAENNWKQILQAFFGPSVYAQLLAPDIESLYPYIKTVVKNAEGEDIEMFRPISTDNLREVIRLIRNDNPNLALRGAQAARFPGGELLTQLSKGMDREVAKGVLRGTDDAVFDVLAAWAMNKDKAEIAGRMAERVINDNPWMVVDLVPSMSAATGGSRAMAESQAALKARAEVLVALNAIGVEDRLTREALSGLYGYLGPGDVSRLIGVRIPPGEPSAIEVFRRIPGTPFMVPSEFTRELQKRVDAAREAFINQAGRGEMRKELREFIKQEKDLNEEIETMFRAVNSAYDDVSASLAKMAQADEKLAVNLARFEELKTKHADAISEYTAKLAEFAKKQKTPQASLFPVKPPDVLFAESRAGRAAEAKIIRAYNELLRGVFEQDTLPEKSGARRAVENLKKAQDDYFDLMKKLEDIDSRLPSARQEAAAVGGQVESQLTKIDEFTRFVLENQADEIEQHLQNVAARRIRPGRFTEDLDNMTVRAYRNLNSVARSDFVKYIYSSMLAEGTQNPDLLLDMVNKLDDPKLNLLFFEKQATTQNILKIMAQIDRTPQSQLTEADRALRDAINRARRAPNAAGRVPTTAAEKQARAGEIVEAVRRALLRNAMNSFVMPVVEEAQQTVRAYGWAPDMERTRQDMTLLAASFDPLEPKFMVAGQDFVESLQELQAAALDGRLATNMDALMRSDALARALGGRDEKAGRAAVQYVTQTLASVLSMPRTLAAGGMLAGGFYMYATDDGEIIPIPAPNTRYLGMNLLTAPFILATTLGFAGPGMAVGRLGPRTQANEVAQQFLAQSPNVLRGPLVDTISPGRMEDVLFTSTTGKTWTRGEVLEAINRNSVNISRGSLEFADSFARDLRRDARLTASGLPAGALRQYLLRNLDPTRTGIFQYVANATDKAIRQNVFASALRAGATEDQAAQLARASVLDYGKGSALGKQMNQYVLFLAFREAMIRETIESIARDPAALNRTILLHDRLSREMDSQLRADYALTRLPYPKTFVFDNSAAARVYGPVHPAIDMYADAVQFAGWVLQTGAKDAPAGVVAQAVADENLSPLVNYIIADFQKSSGAGRGGKVPDEWVAYAIQNSPDGLWAEWKEQFNIVPVTDPELMTPGRLRAADRPGEEKVEYRFETADDAAAFARYLAKLQVLGFERTTADYTKLGLTYNVSDFIDPQKRGLPSTFGFATGLQTPMGEQSPESLQMRAIREQERALRAKQRAQ
jgi:hypothetical protein